MYTDEDIKKAEEYASKPPEDIRKGTGLSYLVLVSEMYQSGVLNLHLDDLTEVAWLAYCAASKQVEAGDMEEAEKIMRSKIQDLLHFAPRVHSIAENERMKQRVYTLLHTPDKSPEELQAEKETQVLKTEQERTPEKKEAKRDSRGF